MPLLTAVLAQHTASQAAIDLIANDWFRRKNLWSNPHVNHDLWCALLDSSGEDIEQFLINTTLTDERLDAVLSRDLDDDVRYTAQVAATPGPDLADRLLTSGVANDRIRERWLNGAAAGKLRLHEDTLARYAHESSAAAAALWRLAPHRFDDEHIADQVTSEALTWDDDGFADIALAWVLHERPQLIEAFGRSPHGVVARVAAASWHLTEQVAADLRARPRYDGWTANPRIDRALDTNPWLTDPRLPREPATTDDEEVLVAAASLVRSFRLDWFAPDLVTNPHMPAYDLARLATYLHTEAPNADGRLDTALAATVDAWDRPVADPDERAARALNPFSGDPTAAVRYVDEHLGENRAAWQFLLTYLEQNNHYDGSLADLVTTAVDATA